MKQIYLIGGKKGSGKDTFGELLQDEFINSGKSVELFSFASPMKQIISMTLGVIPSKLEDLKNENAKIFYEDTNGLVHDLNDFRQVLQSFGSEAMKPVFGEDIWALLSAKEVERSVADIIIFTDFRFPIEYSKEPFIKGFTIKVERDSVTSDVNNNHISETALQNFEFDKIIKNNKTIEDMREIAKQIVKQRNEIE